MKKLALLFTVLLLVSCSKTKTVLICGDHICVNKAEAEQYFEENLSLEVKVINKKRSKDIDLVQLNMRPDSKGNKKISLLNKKKTNKKIKVLSEDEIKEKKAQIRDRKKNRNIKKDQAKLKKRFLRRNNKKIY